LRVLGIDDERGLEEYRAGLYSVGAGKKSEALNKFGNEGWNLVGYSIIEVVERFYLQS